MSTKDNEKVVENEEEKEPIKEEMRREIIFENNSDMSIDDIKDIKELKFRKDFIKWVVVREDKQKKSNYFFGIFN